MGTEFETQVLEIDAKAIKKKLLGLGAKEFPETLQKRFVFDIKCLGAKSADLGEWIRLRQTGEKTTLAYKNKSGTGISETEEIEVGVSDFEKTAGISQNSIASAVFTIRKTSATNLFLTV